MADPNLPPFAAAERFLGFPRGGLAGAVVPAPDGDNDLPDLAEADVEAESRTTTTGGRGRAPRHDVQGGLTRMFGDRPGRRVAVSAPVEVPTWPSRFTVPDPALMFEMEMQELEMGGLLLVLVSDPSAI
uniref:Uncharacterized protein n=1 Tax=Setaria italica TaxID=4555 RepID=K3XR94_SETIT